MPRDRPGDGGERFWRAFHHVAAAGAVDVHIHEARRDGEAARFPPGGARRYGDLIARTHGDNLLAVNDDHGIGYFLARRERAAGKNGLAWSWKASSYWKGSGTRQSRVTKRKRAGRLGPARRWEPRASAAGWIEIYSPVPVVEAELVPAGCIFGTLT